MSLRGSFHLLGASAYWFGCYYTWNYIYIPPDVYPVGKAFPRTRNLKFLEFWNALVQAAFFTLSFIDDLIGKNGGYLRQMLYLRKVRDYLFASMAFPLGIFVSTMFWFLYAINRQLIYPMCFDQYFPWWQKHLMHTIILPFVLIQMVVFQKKYPSRDNGLTILLIFLSFYVLWIHIIYVFTGIWVYPVLEVLNILLRILFLAVMVASILALYVVGDMINQYILISRQERYSHSIRSSILSYRPP